MMGDNSQTKVKVLYYGLCRNCDNSSKTNKSIEDGWYCDICGQEYHQVTQKIVTETRVDIRDRELESIVQPKV